MPTSEEIEEIIKEYVEHICPENGYDSEERKVSDRYFAYNDAKSVINWLLERYNIIPKKEL